MLEAAELARALAGRAEQLCRELLPAGARKGRQWRVGSVANEAGASLAVQLAGPKAGYWFDFATGQFGDLLGLIKVSHRCDFPAAAEWAQNWLGGSAAPTPARLPDQVSERRSRQEAENRQNAARKIFLSAQPRLAGTPADLYLKFRGIDLHQLGRQPRALRFHPGLWNVESRRPWPALVAAVTNGHAGLQAVHRTWLSEVRGKWVKAPLDAPRKALGQVSGGTIRLWRGASGKPLAEAPDGETAVITEGIETGLSIAVSCPERRVLSAVSLNNLARVELPPAIKAVVIAADNDTPGSAAEAVLYAAVRRLEATGRKVLIARSPVGSDFNDCLTG